MSRRSTEPVPPDEQNPARKTWRRPRTLSRFSIQSKVMLMLLVSSLASLGVIGTVEYVAARNALLPAATDRMTQMRAAQKRAIETLFSDLSDSLVVYSRGTTALDAVHEFTAGFDQLANAPVDPGQQRALVDFYNERLIKPIERDTGKKLALDAVLPSNNSQRYLQAHYTVAASRSSNQTGGPPDDAGDGSAWSAANARFNDYFREIATRFEYRDALLLDTRGNVVYSVRKSASLGTNVRTGPYRQSNLRDAYEKAMAANSVNFVWITDFAPYQPQLGQPIAWLTAPIGPSGSAAGVLALPLPISKVNRIMTADKQWKSAGMGDTGETYLAGPDNLMRSDSRLFLEDPQRYKTEALAAGTRPDTVDTAIRWGGTTLVQPVATAAVRAAERGETGTLTDTSYLGRRELAAYAPLSVPNSDLHWSIVATRETAEANARVMSLTQTLVITTTAMVFVICVAALLVAQIFVRPIRRLQAGAQEIGAGNYDVAIPVTSRDEIGELTAAFNEMSRKLQIKEGLLGEQRKENDRLLGSLMPESVAQRYREGEQTIAQEHQDVTVIFADLVGLDEISGRLSGRELVGIVDELIRELDSAAENLGIEPIRTLHNGYLASCGLNFPRLDSVHRTVEFAIEMKDIIARFNARTGYHLALRAGINTGNVISGLVGRSSIVYDMWGAAVNLAYQTRSSTTQTGIYVTSKVYEVMHDIHQFTPAGTVTVGGVEQQIWKLSEG
ncbi:HAMP domain-containing protein [Mycobacterium sp. WUMAC-067]|uniref:adenylate/guanylate cyclase domain-containing protein n=1 Tax=unclassified Mycobacterium TaxID=2642494 RepID=UPI001CD9603E|nr:MULTISPECIES: adenylate/guanylate cyclase domain-containing protein [unclassified Mycobacterium]MCA2245105.1 HAMP domain-containing protein [Mycobacterium sp. WUMAC-067]MCA2316588.1 HAMP domain-containing protein [Mycobacterium sp. WUMAC-025]